MNILFVHNFYQTWGGEDTYAQSTKKLLESKGHKVISFYKYSSSLIGKSFLSKINTAFQFFANPILEKEFIHIIKTEKPDVIHFHNLYPLLNPRLYALCHTYKIPVVQRIPNFRIVCPKGSLFRKDNICTECVGKQFSYPSVIHGCYRNSHIASLVFAAAHYYHVESGNFSFIDAFVFQNSFIRDFFIKQKLFDRKKTHIVPHFVPPSRLNKNKKKGYLYVGRLSEEKGVIPLLDIFTSLPHLSLTIIGSGPQQKQVQGYSKYKNITILPFSDRMRVLYLMKKALFTIIPSRFYETGPHVLMESYSTGTPVIAPKLGVFINQVVEKQTGFLYKPDDFMDLKKLLTTIKLDTKTHAFMSKKNAFYV